MSRFLRHPGSAGAQVVSRSFLAGPDGPAGAPSGHHLRSGGYMAAIRKRDQGKISPLEVSTLSGEPRPPPRKWVQDVLPGQQSLRVARWVR